MSTPITVFFTIFLKLLNILGLWSLGAATNSEMYHYRREMPTPGGASQEDCLEEDSGPERVFAKDS